MKLHRSWTSVLLFLALLISDLSVALLLQRDVGSSAEGIQLVKEVDDATSGSSSQQQKPVKPIVDGIGTKDAPVDGKDGRPHDGPFIETNAERDRKKAKESGQDDVAAAAKPSAAEGSRTKAADEHAKVPSTNDGVMGDPNRAGPKEGTRGTEGGISEKTKDISEDPKLENKDKKLGSPKDLPPSPNHAADDHRVGEKDSKEETKPLSGSAGNAVAGKTVGDGKKDESKAELGGLAKPDLSKKPHDIPPPVPPTSSKSDPLAILKPYTNAIPLLTTATSASIIQPLHSFVLSLTMIIFSEIGDKTFLIAALMAMKHSRLIVFSAAFAALIAMTVLSAILGHAFPLLVPKRMVNFAAAGLFMVFGIKLLREGYAIRPEQGVSEEMREVEMELEEKELLARQSSSAANGRRASSMSPYILEAGRNDSGRLKNARSVSTSAGLADSPGLSDSRSPSPSRRTSNASSVSGSGIHNLLSFLLSPAWVQTFVMTFLGEWGDRSQIATIAMAAGQDYWWVTGGAVTGHGICTAIAVLGGRAIAGRVSLRMVTLGGGFAFLVFGFIYLFEAVYIS